MPPRKPKTLHQRASLLAARHRRRAERYTIPFNADDWLCILWRSRGRCALCGQYMPPEDRTVEHLHSLVDAGSDAWNNIAPAHRACAARKGRKDVLEVLTPAQVRDLHRRLHGPESTDERLLRTMCIAAAESLGLDPFEDCVSTLLLALFARLADSRGKDVLRHEPAPDPDPDPPDLDPDLDPVAKRVFAAAAVARTHALRPDGQAA